MISLASAYCSMHLHEDVTLMFVLHGGGGDLGDDLSSLEVVLQEVGGIGVSMWALSVNNGWTHPDRVYVTCRRVKFE